MRHVLSPAGELQLAATMRARPLLAFDFDGTLAPIVARPDQARMAPGSPRACASWQANGPVAIVTGREVADVRTRLGFEPAYIVGSHGAETEASNDESPWHAPL